MGLHGRNPRVVIAIVFAIVAAEALAAAILAAKSSDFCGDDIWIFYQSRTLPFGEFLRGVVDVHPVPLHRLLGYIVCRLTPWHYGRAVAFLLGLHGLSVFLLYRVLERIRTARLNVVLAGLYGSYVYSGELFLWWTAAVHRIPTICLTLASTLSYLSFRERGRLRDAAGVIAGWVLALGFYEKAALWPLILVGLEVVLWPRPAATPRRARAVLLAGSLVLAAGYFFFWRAIVGPESRVLATNVHALVEHTRVSWRVLVSSLFGGEHGVLWPSALALGVLVGVSIVLSRWNAVVWLVAATLVSLSLLSTGLSHQRTAIAGATIAFFGHRYYPDVLVVLLLFAGISASFVLERSGGRLEPWFRGARGAWCAVVATSALSIGAYVSFARNLNPYYLGQQQTAAFMSNLRKSVETAPRPLLLVEGRIPQPFGYRNHYEHHSILLIALGVPTLITDRGEGVFRVDAFGNLVPSINAPAGSPPRKAPR